MWGNTLNDWSVTTVGSGGTQTCRCICVKTNMDGEWHLAYYLNRAIVTENKDEKIKGEILKGDVQKL